MVRSGGIEPPRLAAQGPQPCVSAIPPRAHMTLLLIIADLRRVLHRDAVDVGPDEGFDLTSADFTPTATHLTLTILVDLGVPVGEEPAGISRAVSMVLHRVPDDDPFQDFHELLLVRSFYHMLGRLSPSVGFRLAIGPRGGIRTLKLLRAPASETGMSTKFHHPGAVDLQPEPGRPS